jgi:hypothetical protein
MVEQPDSLMTCSGVLGAVDGSTIATGRRARRDRAAPDTRLTLVLRKYVQGSAQWQAKCLVGNTGKWKTGCAESKYVLDVAV